LVFLAIKDFSPDLPIQQDQFLIDGNGSFGLGTANTSFEVNKPSSVVF